LLGHDSILSYQSFEYFISISVDIDESFISYFDIELFTTFADFESNQSRYTFHHIFSPSYFTA